MRGTKPRQAHHGLAVDADLAQLLFDRTLVEGAELAQAGVVDQNVHDKAGAFARVMNLLRCGGIVQVRDDDAHLCSFGREFRGQRFEPVFAARCEDEFGAMLCQLPRQCHADPRTGPGDQCPFAVEFLCVCHRGTIIANRGIALRAGL